MHIAKFERFWLIFAVVILVAFFGIITVGALATDDEGLPAPAEIVNPDRVAQDDPRFANPRVEEVAPGVYNAYVVARMFSFTPNEFEFPAGARVNFYVTSPDVNHGFEIAGTDFNAMVVPGYVTQINERFVKPGEYLILCNEYCGLGHQYMAGKVEVK